MNLKLIADRMNALGNETRLNIYLILVRAGEDGIPVGEVQKKLGIPASTLTHHLKRMVLAGLITQEKAGTTLTCRANYQQMTQTIDYFLGQCCLDGRCSTTDTQQKSPNNEEAS